MSDIQKGYTFTEKATDWASNKETALRLNKMIDDAKLNLVAGSNITITPGANGPTIASTGGGGGGVTAVTGTTPIVSSGGATPAISITAATTSVAGSMSAADKTKLNAITGTNTGDQTITLTGGVTGSGTGSFAATVITNANLTGNVTSVGNATTLASIPAISGANLTTLNASNLSSGTVATARGGTGLTAIGSSLQVLRTNSAGTALEYATLASGGTVTSVTATAPVVSTGGNTPVISMAAATNSVNGYLTSTDWNTFNAKGNGTVTSVSGGTGISVSGTTAPTITNSGVTSIVAGSGISINSSTGAVTVTASGGSAIGVPTAGNLYSRLVKNISGTITTSSNMKWSGPDVFNVKDYGATGDGTTSDQTAIAAAFTAALTSSPGGTVYFPAGKYVLTDTLDYTFGSASNVSTPVINLTILGDGQVTSIQQTTSNKGIFKFTANNRYSCITIRNLLIQNLTGSTSTSEAIYLTWTDTIANDWCPNLIIDSVNIAAIVPPGGFNSFSYGLRLRNARMSKINNFHYIGNNAYGGVGIKFEKYVTTSGGQCLGGYISNCTFFGCETGIACADTCEGILSISCAAVAVKYGWYFDYGVQLSVFNSHVNCQSSGGACVYSSNNGAGARVDQSVIIGNDFYPDSNGTNGVVGGFWHSQISNNIFNSASSGSSTIGIDLNSDSKYNSINANIFLTMASFGIRLGSTTANSKGNMNIFDSCGTTIQDNGSNSVT